MNQVGINRQAQTAAVSATHSHVTNQNRRRRVYWWCRAWPKKSSATQNGLVKAAIQISTAKPPRISISKSYAPRDCEAKMAAGESSPSGTDPMGSRERAIDGYYGAFICHYPHAVWEAGKGSMKAYAVIVALLIGFVPT